MDKAIALLMAKPDFLRVWLMGLASGVGRWLEMLVLGVYAFETTGSPFLVALLVILRMAPLALFGPIVGAYADRLNPALFLRLCLFGGTLLSSSVSFSFTGR